MLRSFILALVITALPGTAQAQGHDLFGGVLVLAGAVAGLVLGIWLGKGPTPILYVLAIWMFAVLLFVGVPELLTGGVAYDMLPVVMPARGAITVFAPAYLIAWLLSPSRKPRE